MTTPWGSQNLNTLYGGWDTAEYDPNTGHGYVKTETINGACASCGGGGAAGGVTKTYFYMELNGGLYNGGENEVVLLVVEDTEDASTSSTAVTRRVYGLNTYGVKLREVLLVDDPTSVTTGTDIWCASVILNSDWRITERREPSAHAGKLTSNATVQQFLNPYVTYPTTSWANDTATVNSSAGVVHYYEYGTTYGDGKQVTGVQVRQGAGTGSRYYLSATNWGKEAGDDEPAHLPLYTYEYPSATTTRGDSSRLTTTFTYDFWDGNDTQLKMVTTSLPSISTGENGSGTATTTEVYYDKLGRLRWTKDGEGFINYSAHHPDTGGVAYVSIDVDPSSPGTDVTDGSSGNWDAWTVGSASTNTPSRSVSPTALALSDQDVL